MGARQANRSPRGVQAEAKRRLADRMAKAESALADFLEASEQIGYARQLITSYEEHQQRSLASLIDAIGRDQAADLTGVDDRQIRAALATARTPTGEMESRDEREHDESDRDEQPSAESGSASPDTTDKAEQQPLPQSNNAPEERKERKEPQAQAS